MNDEFDDQPTKRISAKSRQEHWDRISALFKHALWMSALAGISAELLMHIPVLSGLVRQNDPQLARTWVYVSLMYVIVVPLLFVRIAITLSKYRPPHHSFFARISVSFFMVVMCLVWILSPAALLKMGDAAIGRAHLAYLAFTQYLLGTILTGAVIFYCVAIAAWLIAIGNIKLWTSFDKGA